MSLARTWAKSSLWILRVFAGTSVEWRGLHNVPSGGCIIACKHQSLWETFALLTVFDDPAFILKRELMWIPLFGWYAWKSDQIPVNRGKRAAALVAMTEQARRRIDEGRQVLIFPEGTRRPIDAPPAYKFGVAYLYDSIGAPCLPVALNSGAYWPRRSFVRRPGTIVVEFLPIIPSGMPREMFFEKLQDDIETASRRLSEEARIELSVPRV
jgi:1-acyl-sn-glycerol-3-phosphate acyltransferase